MNANLLDYDPASLERLFAELDEKPFRARQLLRWIHQRGEADFARMSDLAKSLRDKLRDVAQVAVPRVVEDADQPCAEARAVAGTNLDDVRAKIADLRRMDGVLKTVVAQCGDGTRPDCPLIESLFGQTAAE